MRYLYTIKDWKYPGIPLYVTDEGNFVVESEYLFVTIEIKSRGYVAPILHRLAHLLSIDDANGIADTKVPHSLNPRS